MIFTKVSNLEFKKFRKKIFQIFSFMFFQFAMDAKSMLEAVYTDLTFAYLVLQLFCENMHLSSKIHSETYTSNLKCKKKNFRPNFFLILHTCNRLGIIPRNHLSKQTEKLDPFGTCDWHPEMCRQELTCSKLCMTHSLVIEIF